MPPAPKPAAKVKPPKARKPRTPLKASKWGVGSKPRKKLKKRGQTKAKKDQRQAEFYASATWRRMKREAKARAGHQCEYTLVDAYSGYEFRCAATERLQVHHKTNARFGGKELPEDLQVLCKAHHDLVEDQKYPHRQAMRQAAA